MTLRIGQLPADVALPGYHRTGVVTRCDDDVRPLHVVVVETVRKVVRRVDADVAQRLEDDGVCVRARRAAGRAYLVTVTCESPKQALGQHRASAVRDADKEHVAHGCASPRTN